MSAFDWIPLTSESVRVGDVVSTDAGGMPIYRVVALAGGEVLVEEDHQPAVLMPLHRLHWKASLPH
jgi:hypothetical protein